VTLPDALYSAFIPFALGLLVGFAAGLIIGIMHTLRRAARRRNQGKTMPSYTDETNPTPGHRPLFGNEHLSKFGIVLAIVGTLAIVGSIVSLIGDRNTSSCLRTYIERTTVTNQERAEAAALERQAIRQQVDVLRQQIGFFREAVANPPADREASRADFLNKSQGWDLRLADSDRIFQDAEVQRQQNPVPLRPAC
jgi:hypothetical protein